MNQLLARKAVNGDYFMNVCAYGFLSRIIGERARLCKRMIGNCTKHFPWCFPFIIYILRHLSFSFTVEKNRRSQLVIGRTTFFTCERRRSRPLTTFIRLPTLSVTFVINFTESDKAGDPANSDELLERSPHHWLELICVRN